MPKRPTDPNAKVLVIGKGWMTNAERDANLEVKLREDRSKRLRDHFVARRLRKPQGQTQPFDFKVNDWAALELFLQDQPTQEFNPGGPDNEHIILAAQQAIEDQDEVALIENLMLHFKANKRAQ
jgi:hypothetical protein